MSHLLGVASLVLEWGGDEDTVIAALLHDAVEDQGGQGTSDLIRQEFGDRVADIVLACTDSLSSDPEAKAPWEDRKRAHIAKVAAASTDVRMVTAADKLYNLTTLVRDVRRDGPATLQRFKRPDRVVWYYGAMTDALSARDTFVGANELRLALSELNNLLEQARKNVEAAKVMGERHGDAEYWVRMEADELLRDMPETNAVTLAAEPEAKAEAFDGGVELARAIAAELRRREAAGVRYWSAPKLVGE